MMKFLHVRRKRQPEVAPPGFSSALGRVRDMREHADWPLAANQTTIHERGERVADARRHVTIPPLASERESPKLRSADGGFLVLWNSLRSLFYGSTLALIAFCIVSLLPEPQTKPIEFPNVIECTMAFALPDAPQYGSLTTAQAYEFADKALKGAGLRVLEWGLVIPQFSTESAEAHLQRINQYEGTLLYRHSHYDYVRLQVTVKLDSTDKYILCTIEPK